MLRVAAMQGLSCTLDVRQNTSSLLEAMHVAVAGHEVDLLVLSELATVPMFTSEPKQEYFDLAETIPGPTTAVVQDFCSEHGLCVLLPMFERTLSGQYFNSACYVTPDGVLPASLPDGRKLPAFRKLHIPASADPDGSLRSNEKFFFYPGTGFGWFDTDFGRIGTLICWDKRFSEAWRVWGLLGVKVVVNPMATWGSWRGSTFRDELRVAAMTNQYFVVGCARAGSDSVGYQKDYVGGAHIVAPDGEVIASQADAVEGHVVYASLDLADVERHRRRTPIYRDRRPELYGILSDATY